VILRNKCGTGGSAAVKSCQATGVQEKNDVENVQVIRGPRMKNMGKEATGKNSNLAKNAVLG